MTDKHSYCRLDGTNQVGKSYVNVYEQGHLHLLLEHPRQTCHSAGIRTPTACTAGALAKSYSNSLLITIRNIHVRPPQYTKICQKYFLFAYCYGDTLIVTAHFESSQVSNYKFNARTRRCRIWTGAAI